MTKQSRIFTLALFSLILLVSCGIYPVVSHLNGSIMDVSSGFSVLDEISSYLDGLALNRARMIDPEYDWLEVEEEVTPSIENSIREAAYPSNNPQVQSLAQDTNLAWTINYNGREYRHNWNDEFSDKAGLIDFTISSDGDRALFSGETIPNVSGNPLSTTSQAIVNPALASESQSADSSNSSVKNTYNYRLKLPEGFSIHFYVPRDLKANGGMIAVLFGRSSESSIAFCMAGGSILIVLFVLLYKKKAEMDSRLVRRISRLKDLGALLLFPALLLLSGWCTFVLSQTGATGELQQTLIAAGFGTPTARVLSTAVIIAIWFAFLTTVACSALYIKYIFAKGFRKYMVEDTVISHAVRRLDTSIQSTVTNPLSTYTRKKALPLIMLLVVFLIGTLVLAAYLFGIAGLLIVAAADLVFILVLAYRALSLVEEDYNKVLERATQLAKGDFSSTEAAKAGLFQPLSDALQQVQASYQKALDDGLSIQISKTQLISNVSHDLKTPVTGIQSYAELIRLSTDPVQIRQYAGRLENYSHRLARLIEDLFDVAKATSGDIRLEPVDLDLTEMIYQVGGEWEDELLRKNLSMVYSLPDSAMAHLDPDKTMRIIDNLLSNIRKYSMEGSRVFVSLEAIPGQYRVIFKNTSKTPLNFEPDEIVERFVRGDRSRHEAGSGLGLAIVKSFMEVQQGSFTVEIDGDLFKAILVFPALQPLPKYAPALPAEKPEDGDSLKPDLLPEEPSVPDSVPAAEQKDSPLLPETPQHPEGQAGHDRQN